MIDTFLTNLGHAACNGETVAIGGGQFGPDELRQVEQAIRAADIGHRAAFASMQEQARLKSEALAALDALLHMPDSDGTQETAARRREIKHAARTILKART